MPTLSDLRLAFRSLARRPGLTVVAALAGGIGIAATTLVFSVVHGVLLRPLPFPAAERLVQVFESERDDATGAVEERGYLAWGNYRDVAAQTTAFRSTAAWQYYDRTLTGTATGDAVRLRGRMVTSSFFATLGVEPALGRGFAEEEARAGAEAVAVLSHGIHWSAFGGDPGILGRTVHLDGIPHTVVGVMPPRFDFPYEAQLWMPLVPHLGPAEVGLRRFHRYRAVGRLAEGATIEDARAELDALAERLRAAHPETNRHDELPAVPLHDVLVGDARPALRVLFAAAGLLLLVGCANVGALLLARTVEREREIGIRWSLGASRGRLASQVLAESLALAGVAGGVGLALAAGGHGAFLTLLGEALPRAEDLRLGSMALVSALAATTASALLFGLAPLVRFHRPPSSRVLHGGRGISEARGALWLRRGLVVGQVALAVLLLVGAALLVETYRRLDDADPGFVVEDLLTLELALPEARYPDPADAAPFYAEANERLAALPEVTSAAAALSSPLAGGSWRNTLHVDGRPRPEAGWPTVAYTIVTAGYFRTLRLPLVAGRGLRGSGSAAAATVVVNRSLAERWFPGESPLGRRVRFAEGAPWATVVGVAADVPREPGGVAEPQAFVSPTVEASRAMTLLVRTTGDPAAVAPSVRAVLREMEPDAPVTRVATMEQRISESLARPRRTSAILGAFALTALFLALVGVHGVLAYAVARRRRELSIRVALGARPGRILGRVLAAAAGLAAAGIALGTLAALAASRLLSGLLHEIEPTAPGILAAVAGAVVATVLLAGWVPAARAARVEPREALQEE